MVLHNCVRVYESSNNVLSDPDKIIFIMDTNDTKPGFTKLKLVNKSILDIIHEWCETVGQETYISSKCFREYQLRDDMVIHGPCQSTANGNYDHASCFRCNEWISPVQQWIYRSRSTWPDYTLVNSAVQYGVLFVPIGCKNSPNEDLQWRISFSVTEKVLIYSFTHTQLLCYALMKIILKDLIKPRHDDILCSYFLKTIIFWISEEVLPSKWKPKNMLSCFLDCFNRLIYCVEYKTCLHYFIPEYNLFEDRFIEEEHKTLLYTLKSIYGSPWTSIFHTETFLSYRLQSENSNWVTLSASALSCFSYTRATYNLELIHSELKRIRTGNTNICRRDMCVYIICDSARKYIHDMLNLTDRNKSFYKQYKRLFAYLKIILQSDSISSWLLLASLFYKCKQYQECLVMTNYYLSRCTPDMIYLNFKHSLAEQTVFEQMKQRLGFSLAFKHLVIEDVRFQYPFYLLPDELIPLVVNENLSIPPVVYSYLLQFLCCHYLGDKRGKHSTLHDLGLTIKERYFIWEDDETLKKLTQIVEIVKTLL
ncbi:uncharacterized protein LOC134683185 [Mytilus trossulus]|uniref:uncharacterized protein LOC134683185 n=1 Tax=Mytilus trossulus TaxID=6551 RepID=UPI0030054B5F